MTLDDASSRIIRHSLLTSALLSPAARSAARQHTAASRLPSIDMPERPRIIGAEVYISRRYFCMLLAAIITLRQFLEAARRFAAQSHMAEENDTARRSPI